MSSFVGIYRSAETTRSELLFTSFVVEHNVPLSATGHAGGLFAVQALFPDSELFIVMFSNVAKLLILSRCFGPLNLPMFGFTSPARGELHREACSLIFNTNNGRVKTHVSIADFFS